MVSFKMASFIFLKIRKSRDDTNSISDLAQYFFEEKYKEAKQHFGYMSENSVFFASEYRDLQHRLYLCKPWSFKVRNYFKVRNNYYEIDMFYMVSIHLIISIDSNKNFDKIKIF